MLKKLPEVIKGHKVINIDDSKQISENLIDDFFQTIIDNLLKEKTLKLSIYLDSQLNL